MQSRKILFPSILFIVALITLTAIGHQRDQLSVGDQEFDRIEVRVNSFTASAQSHISLDMEKTGGIVAAWDSRRQDSGTYGVFARWIGPERLVIVPEESEVVAHAPRARSARIMRAASVVRRPPLIRPVPR